MYRFAHNHAFKMIMKVVMERVWYFVKVFSVWIIGAWDLDIVCYLLFGAWDFAA